jgi:hypothetical protein
MNDRIDSGDANVVNLPLAGDVRRALDRLKSLQEGDLGVVDITACGKRAVPTLRSLLLEGESSGIYQPRCRAVEALAALGAHDVLIEFLSAPREVADPVSRTGEDAVVNAAARALVGLDDERVLPMLISLAVARLWAGVVEALGAIARPEAAPYLLRALAEDHTRHVAEEALSRMGPSVRPALIDIAMRPRPSAEGETESSVRARRSASRLLTRSSPPPDECRTLIDDADPEIAAGACCAFLAIDDPGEKTRAAQRLIELLPQLPWLAVGDAEHCLLDHFEKVRTIIAERLQEEAPEPADTSPAARSYRSLLRVAQRAGFAIPRVDRCVRRE